MPPCTLRISPLATTGLNQKRQPRAHGKGREKQRRAGKGEQYVFRQDLKSNVMLIRVWRHTVITPSKRHAVTTDTTVWGICNMNKKSISLRNKLG